MILKRSLMTFEKNKFITVDDDVITARKCFEKLTKHLAPTEQPNGRDSYTFSNILNFSQAIVQYILYDPCDQILYHIMRVLKM